MSNQIAQTPVTSTTSTTSGNKTIKPSQDREAIAKLIAKLGNKGGK